MYCSCGKSIKFTSYNKHIKSEYHKKHTSGFNIPNLDPMWNSFMDLYKEWVLTKIPFSIDDLRLTSFFDYLLIKEKIDEFDGILKLYKKYGLHRFYIDFYKEVAFHIKMKIYNEYHKLHTERMNKKKNELKLLCMNRLLNHSYIAEPALLKMILKY